MLRRAGMLLTLALLIPACSTDDAGEQEIIVVNNTGSVLIIEVDADADNNWGQDVDDDIAILQPGQTYSEEFEGADEVKVKITRQSDGVVLFSAEYDIDDFEDEDGEILITVNP